VNYLLSEDEVFRWWLQVEVYKWRTYGKMCAALGL